MTEYLKFWLAKSLSELGAVIGLLVLAGIVLVGYAYVESAVEWVAAVTKRRKRPCGATNKKTKSTLS